MQIYKTIKAGPLCRVVVYPKLSWKDKRQRGPRRALTSKAQEKLNLKSSFEKLEALIACNFSRGFWWVTLTYRDADLPETRAAALNVFGKKFMPKLRKHWRSHGTEIREIHCTQQVQSDGSLRLHHHMILNRCGPDDFDVIRSLWTWCDPIDVEVKWCSGRDQITDKAHYMTHEPREHGKLEKGKQTWSCSKNLEHPVVEEVEVPDDVQPAAPYGADVVDMDSVRNEYGAYHYIKYWLPDRMGPDKNLASGEVLTFDAT